MELIWTLISLSARTSGSGDKPLSLYYMHNAKCPKYNRPHKIENHRDIA